MLNLSVKSQYALSAMMYLVYNGQAQPVLIRSIAEDGDIPQHYLEQILVILKRKGLVKSFRGKKGGYQLARLPETITVQQVLEAVEGPLQLAERGTCSARYDFIWERAEKALHNVLRVSLLSLKLEQETVDQVIDYTI